VFCACEIMQLLSVVFFVVRDVGKFDFRSVVNETLKEVVSCGEKVMQ